MLQLEPFLNTTLLDALLDEPGKPSAAAVGPLGAAWRVTPSVVGNLWVQELHSCPHCVVEHRDSQQAARKLHPCHG